MTETVQEEDQARPDEAAPPADPRWRYQSAVHAARVLSYRVAGRH